MTDQDDSQESESYELDFQTVEDLVVAAETKFISYLGHPVFSAIGIEKLKSAKDLARTVQLLEFNEFISTFTNYESFEEEEKQEVKVILENMLKDQVTGYMPGRTEDELPRLLLNFEAYRNNPMEVNFILENIAKTVAQSLSFKGGLTSLTDYVDPNAKIRKQLPHNAEVQLDIHIADLKKQGINIEDYNVRQFGFATHLVRKDGAVIVVDDTLEDMRSDILRTLMEALMYGAVNTKPNSLDKLVSGINNLEVHISKLDPLLFPLYQREHFSIEFLVKYLTENSKTTTVKIGANQSQKVMGELVQLVNLLANTSANQFMQHLRKSKPRIDAFEYMHLQYQLKVWPLDEA